MHLHQGNIATADSGSYAGIRLRRGYTVKRTLVLLGAIVLGLAAVAAAQSQSLGDYAREMRKNKKPSPNVKVYDNDNLPSNATISVLGEASNPKDGEKEEKQTATGDEARKKQQQQMAGAVTEQRKKIAGLQHEIDLLNREDRIRTAEYYSDPGVQLRNPQAWTQQENQMHSEISAKTQELDVARAKLGQLQEAARKAGVPSSAVE
jgi:hypothetical protein